VDVWLAGGIFAVAYTLIALDKMDRTVIALLAGSAVIVTGVITQEQAFDGIDMSVILLLAGMMVIAGIVARTGFFEWLAIRSVRLSRGEPFRLLILLALVTAVLSAFLDNVTTVVLITPITLSVARRLDVSPIPYLLAQVFASNIGGTATLIGDPPNILIGSAAGLDFNDFLVNVAPVVVVVFLGFVGVMWLLLRGRLQVPAHRREAAVEMTEAGAIKDRPLLIKSLVVVALTIAGFLFHSALGLEPATVALLGAAVMMLVARVEAHDALKEVEWTTLAFFVGLFVLVEAVIEVGIVSGIANTLAEWAGGDATVATLGILWFSAIVSALVDNIPYTATAIPIVKELGAGGIPIEPMWWALSLGACLGGNLTIVGASANVVVANMLLRSGQPISFMQFLRYGSLVVLVSMLISTAYVWVRYLA
jgi:Na+/H+ antiporter NhaD/arsenite permease-like protein